MMTEIEKKVYEKLRGVVDEDDAAVDARELCRAFSGDALSEAVERRISGEPLQYIIGEWDFYNCTFRVGEGVLIPRPETELLVDEALKFLTDVPQAKVLDLCAGSGCIGISIAKNTAACKVFSVEKTPAAYEYLKQNAILNGVKGKVFTYCDDILEGCDFIVSSKGGFDLIVSNPPYVKSAECDTLQREVMREPREALDGGEDGLLFYRAIAERWLPLLRKGGLLLVECGEDQAEDVVSIFKAASDGETYTLTDFAGIQRAVAIKT